MRAAFSNLSQLVLRIPKASPWSQTCEKRPKVRGTVKLNQGPFNLKSCQCYSKILQISYLERALRWALYRETKSSYAEHQKNGHSLAALQAINCEQLLVSNCHNKDASLDYCSWHHLYLRHCSYGPMQLARWRTETIDFKRQEAFTRYYIHTLEISYWELGKQMSKSFNLLSPSGWFRPFQCTSNCELSSLSAPKSGTKHTMHHINSHDIQSVSKIWTATIIHLAATCKNYLSGSGGSGWICVWFRLLHQDLH